MTVAFLGELFFCGKTVALTFNKKYNKKALQTLSGSLVFIPNTIKTFNITPSSKRIPGIQKWVGWV